VRFAASCHRNVIRFDYHAAFSGGDQSMTNNIKNTKNLGRALACVCLLAGANLAHAATEISWWHSMTGALGERVAALADEFNHSQSEYKVNQVFKGA
jgi:hypothetical protein